MGDGLLSVRAAFGDEARRRWTVAAREVKRAILQHDALGIGDKAPQLATPSADKAALFKRWLSEQLTVGVVAHDGRWMEPHVEAAAAHGALRVMMDAQQQLGFLVTGRPRRRKSIKIRRPRTLFDAAPSVLACRAATAGALAEICDETSEQAHQSVAHALTGRARPAVVAKLVDAAMGRGLWRTKLLAEHAVTQAFTQATLDGLEARGVRYVGTLSEHAQALADFDPDEPRDESGKWTSGGSGYEFVSPNVGSIGFDEARKALAGERERTMLEASHDVDRATGISGTDGAVIGAWADGAEHSIMTEVDHADWDRLILAAAMKGHLADQKQVLVFQELDPAGSGEKPTAALYSFDATGDLGQIHQHLLDDGAAFHTLQPTSDGAKVWIADPERSDATRAVVKTAAGRYGSQVDVREGRAEFLGTTQETGTDREQRDDARRVYAEIIGRSAVPGAASIWQGVHHRWGQRLAEVADALALFDYARLNPQAKHPRTGQFAKAHVVARETRRHKKTGRFQKQGIAPEAQRKAELAEMRFGRVAGKLDVMTQGDDRVCDVCDGISAGGPYTINAARSLIPAHPNCRCLFVAAGAMRDALIDFDPDQPRDDSGQWTTAFHGSAATFEKFDLEHMLSGEGGTPASMGYSGGGGRQNEYGHGIYLAENPAVAQTYGEQIGASQQTAGHVYQVAIHAKPDEFLDWDKPLEAQPQAVQDLVRGRAPAGTSGAHLMMGWIGTGPKGAARMVKAGLKGVRYLDQGSRAVGAGTSNYVVMDPSALEITHRDGVRLSKAEAHDAWLADFDPDQPRDERGEWTTGGPPAHITPEERDARLKALGAKTKGDLIAATNAADRARFAALAAKGPLTFYHGTASDAVRKIMKRGLEPHGGEGADKWMMWHGGSKQELQVSGVEGADKLNAERLGSVYITESKFKAESFANAAAEVHPGSGATVLKVTIPADKVGDIVHDELAVGIPAYRFHGKIDPAWISVEEQSYEGEPFPYRRLAGRVFGAHDAEPLVLYLTVLSDEAAALKDFNPDEPRDPKGEWTASSGGLSAKEHALSATDILDDKTEARKARSASTEEIGKELNDRGQAALKALGVKSGKIEGPDPKTDELLAKVMAHEVATALKGSRSGSGWYSAKMKETFKIAAKKWPEIGTDDNAKMALTAALAITSQGEKVPSNVRLATEAYEAYRKTGQFPHVAAANQKGVNGNFDKLNALIKKAGPDGAREFLSRPFKVKQLTDMGYKISGEVKTADVYGSAIFGPKIGQGFYQNLNQNFKPMTFDLWWMRAWGRLTGTLTGGMDKEGLAKQKDRLVTAMGADAPRTDKALHSAAEAIVHAHERDFKTNRALFDDDVWDSGEKVKAEATLAAERYLLGQHGLKEQPAGGAERQWMRSVGKRAMDILKSRGIDMTPADLQATWWYPEKTLYEKMGGIPADNLDYADAFKAVMEKTK